MSHHKRSYDDDGSDNDDPIRIQIGESAALYTGEQRQNPSIAAHTAKARSRSRRRVSPCASPARLSNSHPCGTTPPNSNSAIPQLPQSTPQSHKLSGVDYVKEPERNRRLKKLAAEMKGKFVGPMPPEEFINAFLPSCDANQRNEYGGFSRSQLEMLAKAVETNNEEALYEPLAAAIRSCCKKLQFKKTSARADPEAFKASLGKLKPDLTAYDGANDISVTDFSLMEVHIEIKHKPTADGFWDLAGEFEHITDQSLMTRGQITAYAVAQLARQNRTHIFSVVIAGSFARLIRWDRAGAIVTNRFSFTDPNNPPYLVEFFRRYDSSSSSQRGIDDSIRFVEPMEAEPAFKALGLQPGTTLIKFLVYEQSHDDPKIFIGYKPISSANTSLTGRATRTFAVYDPTAKALVCLKDTWRIDASGMVKEGDIYQMLQAANVPFIPTFQCGGDIPGLEQTTLTQDYVTRPWAKQGTKSLRKHQHYRFVVREVAQAITKFRSSFELVTAMGDALQAHKEAYEKTRVLHRDISSGNIMIDVNGRGLLIDWDMCKQLDGSHADSPRNSERTGTWPFMSAMLMQGKVQVHTLADDLESFLHVLSWVVLLYAPNDRTPADLTQVITNVFEESYEQASGAVVGGSNKEGFICGNIISKQGIRNAQLAQLLYDLTEMVAPRYKAPPPIATTPQWQEKHAVQIKPLETGDCMLAMFRTAVHDPAAWPKDDAAANNLSITTRPAPSNPDDRSRLNSAQATSNVQSRVTSHKSATCNTLAAYNLPRPLAGSSGTSSNTKRSRVE